MSRRPLTPRRLFSTISAADVAAAVAAADAAHAAPVASAPDQVYEPRRSTTPGAVLRASGVTAAALPGVLMTLAGLRYAAHTSYRHSRSHKKSRREVVAALQRLPRTLPRAVLRRALPRCQWCPRDAWADPHETYERHECDEFERSLIDEAIGVVDAADADADSGDGSAAEDVPGGCGHGAETA